MNNAADIVSVNRALANYRRLQAYAPTDHSARESPRYPCWPSTCTKPILPKPNTSAADWRRFGRAPGFTNRKPQHRDTKGLHPFARLISSSGQPFAVAEPFRTQLLATQQQIEQQRAASRLSFAAKPSQADPLPVARHPLPLPHVSPLHRTASCRRYGVQHRRLRSGMGRGRHSRRTRRRLSLPRH